jgi:glutamate-1-semialdehyde aminotransferase
LIPGATQLISRRASRFAYGVSPIYAARAQGSHLWDVDGGEYIDWMCGVGAIILGYADPVVDAAVKERIDQGTIFTINHEVEIELAEELVRTIPCAEMVRYAKGGGEACAIAVRIARGATGRDKVLFCGYHGWHDWYMAANLVDDKQLDDNLFPGIEPIGVPRALAGTALPFRYGDLAMLEGLLKQHQGEVAGIIMEPMRSEYPAPGYLEGVRELATRCGVVLIFDEVSCGFRPALGGAQELLGVTPDMAVFAKAISNGYPMGAVVGKREVMEPARRMFISSLYWSDTVGIVAALTTIRELRRRNGVAHIAHITELLQQGLNAAAAEAGAPVRCLGTRAHLSLQFQVEDSLAQKKAITLYVQEMAKRGIIATPGIFVGCAHTEDDVAQTVAAAREAFGIIQEGLTQDRLDDLLECELQTDLFRRLVR